MLLLRLCVVVCAVLFAAEAMAQGARRHSVAMADAGTLYHAATTENVAYLSHAGLFPRVKAHAIWRTTPGHRQNLGGPRHNLPMGRVAVVRQGGAAYVTGRKLFPS